MIIDNVFNIKTYLGSQALPVVNPPASLASDATYSTFISNISSIYGTQAINGSIPYLFKTGGVVDVNSTLKTLEPKQSYYFVSKSNAVFPYNIPYSGSLMPFTTYGNCPVVNLSSDIVVLTSTSGNHYYCNQNISNLNIGENYTYSFRVVDSNWPVTIFPSSGSLQSSQNVNNIGALIRFDNDSGVTDYSTFLPPRTSLSQLDKKNLFAVIEVSVTAPSNIGCPKVLDTFMMQCNSCVPLPTPTPSVTPTPTPTPVPTFASAIIILAGATSIISNGITFVGNPGDKLEVTHPSPFTGTPKTMIVNIGGTQVCQITFNDPYTGRSFKFTRSGSSTSYIGTFVDGTVNF